MPLTHAQVKPAMTENTVHHDMLSVVVERGDMIESRHQVSLVVSDTKGKLPLSFGDPEQATYPRSAIKPLQALVFAESGAVQQFGLDQRHISFACASHNAEQGHLMLAQDWLARLGLDDGDFACGGHAPMNPITGGPRYSHAVYARVNNNCSGKHLGFLSAAVARGWPTQGYIKADHAVQQAVLGTLEQVCAVDLSSAHVGIDGCGIPTIAMPLGHLALGMARFGAPDDLPTARAEACQKIAQAIAAEPFYIAGSSRCCTAVNTVLGRKAMVKFGAEGVYCAALPEMGLGLALKVRDGGKRAAEVALLWALEQIGVLEPDTMSTADLLSLSPYRAPQLRNFAGDVVGRMYVDA